MGDKGTKPYTIRKFDLTKMQKDSTICIIGKRRSGKSFLMRDILYHFQDFPKGVVISETESANPFFKNFVPDSFIYDNVTPDLLNMIIQRQKRRIQLSGNKDKARMFLVMDDCLASASKWKNSDAIKELFMNGRHLAIFYIVTLQYMKGISPDLRGNLDYIFVFKDTVIGNRRKLYETFAGAIPSFELFCSILDMCTEDYKCLVFSAAGDSNRMEDCVFWYKAEDHGPFKVGGKQFWDVHDERYNPNHALEPAPNYNSTLNLLERYQPQLVITEE